MISILTPVHNTDPKLLTMCINSVKKQSFSNWELCLVNDGSTNPATITYLRELHHPKIKVKHLEQNVGIGAATEEAFKISTGEYIAFMDSDDELAYTALELSHFNINKYEVDIVYSDEALLSMDDNIIGAHFKPDYSPDLLLSQNYICHFVVLKRQIYIDAGGLRPGFDGSQDHDFLLRVSEKTKNFYHIPEILYYWRTVPSSITHDSSSKGNVWDRGVAAIQESLSRRELIGTAKRGHTFGSYIVRYELQSTPLISIIIPFKDNLINLKRCISEIKNSSYTNYEIIIVTSTDEILNKLSDITEDNIKVINRREPFNFSKLLNEGILASEGEHIITLHDDVFPLKKDWIEALLEHSQRTDVGCVGAKLLYPNKTIQHAGVVVGVCGVCVHSFINLSSQDGGYYGRTFHIQNVSAVTGSCMMFKRNIFNIVGGFDEKNIVVDFSDIDFCLRVQKKGFLNIYTSECEAEHLARGTRGSSLPPNLKTKLVGKDTQHMKLTHSEIISNGDPFYNKNLSKVQAYKLPRVIKNEKIVNPNIRPHPQKTTKVPPNQVRVTAHCKPLSIKENPLISFIVPLYNQYPIAVPSLIAQEYTNFEILVIHDGPIPDKVIEIIKGFKDNRIKLLNTDKRYNDWGHTPREYGLDHVNIASETVVFTGADNYYIPKFLSYMVPCFSDSRIVGAYCNCLHNYWDWTMINTRLTFGSIDCGCFMVRTDVAKKIGWRHRVHEADWMFIQNLLRTYGRNSVSKVAKTLFIHN